MMAPLFFFFQSPGQCPLKNLQAVVGYVESFLLLLHSSFCFSEGEEPQARPQMFKLKAISAK